MARILITGSSTGLGLDTARALAAAGHDVVGHVRNRSRMPADDPGWRDVVVGDLTDPEETRAVAEQANRFGRFDAVVHNAGVYLSADEFAVNALAPYVLTALMAKPGRLIYLTSGMHRSGSTDLSRIDRGVVDYSDSKLYVTTLAMICATRWAGTVSHAVDPGWVPTRMGGAGAPDDLTEGHRTQVRLATADDVQPPTGGYWYHGRTRPPHPAATDPAFQRELLERLAERTGIVLPG